MSLYEQFHSEINKTFMFNMIKGVIENERSIDISIDPKNYDEFLLTLEPVFNKNNGFNEIGKCLLDSSVTHVDTSHSYLHAKLQLPIFSFDLELDIQF